MQGTFREEYGTAHKLYDGKQYYAGKTGTTNDNKDAWFCGYSKYYTTAVWAGCDTPRSVDGLKGSSYPASIWMDFMSDIHKDKKKQILLFQILYILLTKRAIRKKSLFNMICGRTVQVIMITVLLWQKICY